MSKKGLISSLVLGIAVTLALGIYTIVSVVMGNSQTPVTPVNSIVNVAYRTGDITNAFEGYSEEDGTLEITLEEGVTESPLVYNPETGLYEAKSSGKVTITIKTDDKGNTVTYNIVVHAQGSGTNQDSPFVIATAQHLKEFADSVNSTSASRSYPQYTKLVADIDLGEYNWKPIGGQGNTHYEGTFDGAGYTIKNLTINVNANNYQDFIVVSTSSSDNITKGFIDLGLFGNVEHSKITNLNMSNAQINVNSNVYSLLGGDVPDSATYSYISRLSIGTVVGTAYDTEIEGSTAMNKVDAKVVGFSWAYSTNSAHAIGGMVGIAQLVRVSNYDVKLSVENNNSLYINSYIGGIMGYAYSSYASNDETITTPSADDKTSVDNIIVDFNAEVLYFNNSRLGGIIAEGYNLNITNSTVKNIKVNDTSVDLSELEDTSRTTSIGGIAAWFFSSKLTGKFADNAEIQAAFISNVKNVIIENIDINVTGGRVGGAFCRLGRSVTDTFTDTLVVEDVVVNGGYIRSYLGSGFAYRVYPGATVKYTKVFENPVINNLTICADNAAGFVDTNNGTIEGYSDPDSGYTKIDVELIGHGAYITSSVESLYVRLRNRYIAGLVGEMWTVNANNPATLSNFDVKVVGKDSINMAGIVYYLSNTTDVVGVASISNINVNADFTSYNLVTATNNFSTTYMVSGAVCMANAGSSISNINTTINVNKDVDKSSKYGASFFGGILARYTGDQDTFGLSIDACNVSGEAYFNYAYVVTIFNDVAQKIFVAGGLVGAMESEDSSSANTDGLSLITINNVTITNNNVSSLKITADIDEETADPDTSVAVVGNQGFRFRALGALVGTINSENVNDTSTLDLSSNTISSVEIVADTDLFTYYIKATDDEAIPSIRKITIGAGKAASYGGSWKWESGNTTGVADPDLSGITYTEID